MIFLLPYLHSINIQLGNELNGVERAFKEASLSIDNHGFRRGFWVSRTAKRQWRQWQRRGRITAGNLDTGSTKDGIGIACKLKGRSEYLLASRVSRISQLMSHP